jgi:hypothetical protein
VGTKLRLQEVAQRSQEEFLQVVSEREREEMITLLRPESAAALRRGEEEVPAQGRWRDPAWDGSGRRNATPRQVHKGLVVELAEPDPPT